MLIILMLSVSPSTPGIRQHMPLTTRSALYPSITLSGSAGWTNNGGMGVSDPGKLLLSAAGSLLQPIFNAGANRANLKIAKAQQEEAKLSFRQTLLNAGAEVNNALTQCQSARAKRWYRRRRTCASSPRR